MISKTPSGGPTFVGVEERGMWGNGVGAWRG